MRFAELLGWRWTPAFALVGGSLLFVLLAVVIVPDELGAGLTAPSGRVRTPGAPGSASAQAVTADAPKVKRPTPARRIPGSPAARSTADHRVESPLEKAPELPAPLPYEATPEPPPAATAADAVPPTPMPH
jgi:hypothetical protein